MISLTRTELKIMINLWELKGKSGFQLQNGSGTASRIGEGRDRDAHLVHFGVPDPDIRVTCRRLSPATGRVLQTWTRQQQATTAPPCGGSISSRIGCGWRRRRSVGPGNNRRMATPGASGVSAS